MNKTSRSLRLPQSNWIILLSGLLFCVYLAWVAARPQNVFWTVDEGGKFIYIQNTIRSGNPAAPLDYPARTIDPTGEFYPSYFANHVDHNIYMWWQVGFPLMASIFYQVIGWLGLYVIPAACGAATAGLTAAIVGLLIPGKPCLRYIALAITGLATPIAFYSTMFWEHTLTTCFATAAAYFLLKGEAAQKPRWYYFAGISTALAIFFRVEVILLLAGFGLVILLRNWKNGLRYGLCTLIFLAPLMFLHTRVTGTAFTPVLTTVTAGQSFQVTDAFGLRFLAYFLFNPSAVWTLGLPDPMVIFGTVAFFVLALGTLIKPLRWMGILGAGLTLIIPVWILFNPSGYRSLQGLITASPVIIFSLWLFIHNNTRRTFPLPGMTLTGIIFTMAGYLYKSWVGAGGLQWGPRYILSLYPLLVAAGFVGLYEAWPQISRLMQKVIIVLFICATLTGFGFQVRGALSVRTIQQYYQSSEAVYRQYNDRPIVTAWCDIVYLLPNLYWDQQFVSVTRSGLNRWAEYAKESGIESFYVANLDLCTADFLDKVKENRQENPTGLTIIPFRTVDFPRHE